MNRMAVVELQAEPPASQRERGYWVDAWRELRGDWAGMTGLAIVVVLVLVAALAPVIAPHNPNTQFENGLTLSGLPLGPSHTFPLGTDQFGRDLLSRLMYGARVSLAVGIGGNLLASLFAIVVGGVAGMARPLAQTAIMRLVDVILSFPVLLLALTLLIVTKPSVITIMLIVGCSFGAYVSRIVFAQAVSLREREFVLAATASGVRKPWIFARHIVPHVMPAVIVFSMLGVASAIQLEAALSYVGIGIQPPTASWGNMISGGQDYLVSSPWLVLTPGAAIMVAMVGFSMLGDGLRDALDPTLSRRLRIS